MTLEETVREELADLAARCDAWTTKNAVALAEYEALAAPQRRRQERIQKLRAVLAGLAGE